MDHDDIARGAEHCPGPSAEPAATAGPRVVVILVNDVEEIRVACHSPGVLVAGICARPGPGDALDGSRLVIKIPSAAAFAEAIGRLSEILAGA
jgi:hypothetical protein